MNPRSTTEISRAADILGHFPSPELCQSSEMSHNSCSSGCSSCYGSPSNCMILQRSHSLQKNICGTHHPVYSLFAELMEDSDNVPVRKVYSTGDLQGINNVMQRQNNRHYSESAYSSESSMIIEGMSRAYPYSPEEKKVRIERYRIKRNQRNFNKKIKYACRKTLADSRPRIRGRFAKNEERDNKKSVDEEEEDNIELIEDENWANFFETLVVSNLVQDDP